MSEEQLSALLAKLKDEAGLQEKFKGAADLDAAVAIAKQAGFDVSKEEWLMYQSRRQTLELSDEELEQVAGGNKGLTDGTDGCTCTREPRTFNSTNDPCRHYGEWGC
jgi:predicted ribosomally synthesized peptide with nif11-like leader